MYNGDDSITQKNARHVVSNDEGAKGLRALNVKQWGALDKTMRL